MDIKQPLIAIDGPAGAGKSSTARAVAKKLGLPYLDTGALYRAVTLAVQKKKIANDTPAINRLIETVDISFTEGELGTRVWIDGDEVTDELRSNEVTKLSSKVCMIPEVRERLSKWQKRWASRGFGVMEGRDVGTVILPDAGLKIYMTAKPDIRAIRRAHELGIEDDAGAVANLAKEIAERDERDSNRKLAPLSKAEDAVVVDTSDLTFDEQVDKIIKLAAERFNLTIYGKSAKV